jgi:hypothetical protein
MSLRSSSGTAGSRGRSSPGGRRPELWGWRRLWRERLQWGRRLWWRGPALAVLPIRRWRGWVHLLPLHRLRPLPGVSPPERRQSRPGLQLGPELLADGADAFDRLGGPGRAPGQGPELQPADVPRPCAGCLLRAAEGLDGPQSRTRPASTCRTASTTAGRTRSMR